MANCISIRFFILALLLLSANAQAVWIPMTNGDYKKIHQAVFDTFIPFTNEVTDTTKKQLLINSSKEVLVAAKSIPELKGAFFLFNHLHLFHSIPALRMYYRLLVTDKRDAEAVTEEALEPVKNFLHGLPNDHPNLSLDELTAEQRFELFTLLIQSPVKLLRFAGFYVRVFYNQQIFAGSVGEKISGYAEFGNIEAGIVPDFPKFKTHLIYNQKKKRLVGEVDVIVVGSGPSGSVAAYELQRAGFKVVVVEAGPLIIPGAVETKSHQGLMENNGPRLSENGSIALLNGEGVGGGTLVNLDMTFAPTIPHVLHRFHQWHAEGIIPDSLWTDDELNRASTWVNEKFNPRIVDEDEVNENNEILRRGARKLGLNYRFYELNSYKDGTSPHAVTNKKTSFETLLLPAMKAEEFPITVLSNCRVSHVLMKQSTAYGVECVYEPRENVVGTVSDLYDFRIKKGSKVTIRAKNVILAAGNLGTTRVLLQSDIDNDNIGRGYVAHPFVSLMGTFDHLIRADVGEQSTILIDHFMQTDERPNEPGYLIETGLGRLGLWALLVPGTPGQMTRAYEKIDHVGGLSVLLTDTPNPNNYVSMKHGKMVVHYELSESDKARMIDGIKNGVRILFAAGAKEVSFNTFEKLLFQKSKFFSNTLTPEMDLDKLFADFKLETNQTSVLGAHMMGGNKIGIDPKTSVVDENYAVHNTTNLFVIDASVYPGSVGANPMQTIYVTAKIFTERFLALFDK